MTQSLELAYRRQRNTAKHRGIKFLLTFEEWLVIWEQSGKLPNRGKFRGNYVMSRYGDKGPYAIGNVFINLLEDNIREASVGRIKTPQETQRSSIAMKAAWQHCANLLQRDLRGSKNGRAKLTERDIRIIRKRYRPNSKIVGTVALGYEFGVSNVVINNIVKRKSWRHVK